MTPSDRPASISREEREHHLALIRNAIRLVEAEGWKAVAEEAREALAALSVDERPTAAMLAAGMSAWEATAGTREDMLRNAYVAMNEYRLSTTKAAVMDSREERVARALYEQQFPGSVWPHSADRAESWREMARAAIAALSVDERLIEALTNARPFLVGLTKQGEDNIWRPAQRHLEAFDAALAGRQTNDR